MKTGPVRDRSGETRLRFRVRAPVARRGSARRECARPDPRGTPASRRLRRANSRSRRPQAGRSVGFFVGEDRFDRRARPLQGERKTRDFGGDVVDAFAQQRILRPLGGPGRLGSLPQRGGLAPEPGGFLARRVALLLEPRLFRLQGVQPVELAGFPGVGAALRQDPALLGQPLLQFLDALAEHFGFRGLRNQLAFQLSDTGAEARRLGALLGKFLCGGLGRFAGGFHARAGLLEAFRRDLELRLVLLDLRLQRGDLEALVVVGGRALTERVGQLGELVLLAGERVLDVLHPVGLEGIFLLRGAELFARRILARFERKNRRGLLVQLVLELFDRHRLLAEFVELGSGLGLELLHAHLQPPRGHRELGAQLVLLGLDFRHRVRRFRIEPAHGQAHGAIMDQRNEEQIEQTRNQEPDREEHQQFDHVECLRSNSTGKPDIAR